MDTNFDIVVVGSGIAGLSYALKCANLGKRVCIITKKSVCDTNTNKAQGGIASVTSGLDDFKSHIKDTLIAGDGLCDEAIVKQIIEAGPSAIRDLIENGVEFTSNNGEVALGKEGGHSQRRILHVKDYTGKAIEEALVEKTRNNPNIEIYENHFAVDLITSEKYYKSAEKRVIGIYVLDKKQKKVHAVKAKAVMLSSGGSGRVYLYTTNPSIATGDGLAIAYRAGAKIQNLEFIQFHPTALYSQDDDRFLISEAVRGEGAILRDTDGNAFMHKYDSRKDLAPRDIVARAIDTEMKKHGSNYVYLDITHLGKEELMDRFPKIFEHCLEKGIDISKDFMPVVPAAHYQCGGIQSTINGETNIKGLYACGEVSNTGLHGANRLASNSLLEAIVVANNASAASTKYIDSTKFKDCDLDFWVDGSLKDPDERFIISHNMSELKRTMWDYVGIVRSDKRLQRAERRIKNLLEEIDEYYCNFKVEPKLLELRNMLQVARLIIMSARKRKESRGLQYTLDYPLKSKKIKNTSFTKK
ncbi:MAG: L-aspartate oxidase [Opitutales bacterium]